MRVLIVHNRYQQKGGEDGVVANESALLAAHGHDVEVMLVDNDHIQGAASKVVAAISSMYSLSGQRKVEDAIRAFRPDVVHVHNFFPTLSPAIFRTCTSMRVPVVHTLHNYRIVCAAATLFRDGHICEDCVTQRSMMPGIKHACYRGSRVGSAVNGMDMLLHQYLHTWQDHITSYIALTEFAADKMSTFRIPRAKIHIKPNFAVDQGAGDGEGDFALFAGRFTEEKGVRTLLEADLAGALCMDVVVLGDGPLRHEMEQAASLPGSRLRLRGFVDKRTSAELMRSARVLLLPSLWYEGFPLVLVEALSAGLPVLAADQPNLRSVLPLTAGAFFAPGNATALAKQMMRFATGNSVESMRKAARTEYLEKYTPEVNVRQLVAIYESAVSLAGTRDF